MASNSHRRSGSSDRSSQRKKVHVGTGTSSRKASAHPHTTIGEGDRARSSAVQPRTGAHRGVTTTRRGDDMPRPPQRPQRRVPTAKQVERDQKRAEQQRVLRRRIAVVAAAVLAVVLLWVLLVNSQLFEIEDVEVVGASAVSSSEVLDRAAIEDGETLLRVDEDAIVRRLTEDPWIEDASIARRLPSTLRIEVAERVPAAVIDTGVSFWFVEENGRVIAESVASSATVVPVIRDIPDFVAEPGKVSDSATLANALDVLAGLSDELRASIRSVTAPSVSETTVLTASGVEITVGEAEHMDEKSAIIRDILAAQGSAVVFIDVRSIERPISRGLGD